MNHCDLYTGWSKKADTRLIFAITSANEHRYWPFCHCYNKKCITHKYKVMCATSITFNLWPRYLAKDTLLLLSMQCYYVCFADVSLWPIDSVLKDQLNKRSYSSETAVFDMSTVIPDNTCKATTPLVNATVNETPVVLCYSPHIKQCTTIELSKAVKNEQNTDST